MAKKKFKLGFKVELDSPVAIFFSAACIVIFLLDYFILKGKISQALTCSPTTSAGTLPFEASNPLSYLRIIFYTFGFENPATLVISLIFIMLLGPATEAQYGSVIVGIMMGVSAIFSGVLNACFCPSPLRGASSIIFMLIFLNSFMSFTKKKIPLSFIFVIVLFVAKEIIEKWGSENGEILKILICIAGGLCGSLLAFLTSPKARAEKKYNKAANEIDSQSPRFLEKKFGRKKEKSKAQNDDEDDSTVIGTLKF